MRKKLLSALSAAASAVFLLSTLSGCGAKLSVQGMDASYAVDDRMLVDDLQAEAKSGKFKASKADQAFLSEMTKTLSNEHLELYLGKYSDIALLDKDTGAVYFSNRAIYDASLKLNDQSKAVAYSQVSLEYYDGASALLTMSSFPECVDENGKNQVAVTASDDDEITLTYTFGAKESDRIICYALTPESYQKLSELATQKIDEGTVSIFDYSRFDSSYLHIVLSELDESEQKSYIQKYPAIKELGELYIISEGGITDVQRTLVEEVSKALGMDKTFIENEKKAVGSSSTTNAVQAYFEIPVTYQLQGRDFLAKIDSSKIVGVSGYKLSRIYLLSNFHAATPGEDGYLFIPDGSGAVIESNSKTTGTGKIDLKFYGSDFAVDMTDAKQIQPYSSLPVFGIRKGGQSVFAVVENGDALGGVQAQLANTTSPSNTVSPWFSYYTNDVPTSEISKQQKTIVTTYIYSKKTPKTVFSVRYHFLYGENAGYSGMARYYQNYLKQQGVLKPAESAKDLRLDVGVIGSITKKKLVLFMPMNVRVAASTFADVGNLAKEFAAGGVQNLNLIYHGAINGGMDFQIPSSVDIENSLGGADDFAGLQNTVKEIGAGLTLSVDFTKVYKKGNGLNVNNQISRFISKEPAVLSGYYPSSEKRDMSRAAYLINPMSYRAIVSSFEKSAKKLNVGQLLAASAGSFLSGNYDDRHELTREQSKNLTANALKMLGESGFSVAIDGGNAYALRYADTVVDIPVDSSGFRIESYSVPFVSMVLHGYMDYSGPVLNQQGNYQKALLKNIENGAGLQYLLMTGDQLVLTDTAYSDYYSVSAEKWKSEITSSYQELNKIFRDLSGCTISGHRQLSKNVFETVYSNGTKIIVNYNDHAVTQENTTVGAMSYQVVK